MFPLQKRLPGDRVAGTLTLTATKEEEEGGGGGEGEGGGEGRGEGARESEREQGGVEAGGSMVVSQQEGVGQSLSQHGEERPTLRLSTLVETGLAMEPSSESVARQLSGEPSAMMALEAATDPLPIRRQLSDDPQMKYVLPL